MHRLDAGVRAAPRARGSIVDAWFRLRNRILGSASFQRWAARFPLTRFIARRRASQLFDLCAGFVYSQILHATVRLGVLDALCESPLTFSEISARLSMAPNATRRLLHAAASLKLVEPRSGDRYGLGVHGASLLGNPGALAMIEHHALFYRDLADPVALLRGERGVTELNRFWSYADKAARPECEVAGYSKLMSGSLSLLADDVLEAYPHDRHRVLLDVGGGEGAFLEAAAARAPHLSLVLFDLPAVAERARERLRRANLASRSTIVGGDMLRDPLPTGADLISLVRVVHDHDDLAALDLLRSAHRALLPGGTLIVAEPMADTPGAEPMGAAYFGFYLLAMGQGRPRSPSELAALLRQAGFDRVTLRKTRRPMLAQLLLATKS